MDTSLPQPLEEQSKQQLEARLRVLFVQAQQLRLQGIEFHQQAVALLRLQKFQRHDELMRVHEESLIIHEQYMAVHEEHMRVYAELERRHGNTPPDL